MSLPCNPQCHCRVLISTAQSPAAHAMLQRATVQKAPPNSRSAVAGKLVEEVNTMLSGKLVVCSQTTLPSTVSETPDFGQRCFCCQCHACHCIHRYSTQQQVTCCPVFQPDVCPLRRPQRHLPAVSASHAQALGVWVHAPVVSTSAT